MSKIPCKRCNKIKAKHFKEFEPLNGNVYYCYSQLKMQTSNDKFLWSYMPLDNLTYIERLAKKRHLV